MITIEDRVRAATRAIADAVPPDDVPPLRLPDYVLNGGTGAGLAGWRRADWGRSARWLAPAAAAVAVIALAVTLVVVRAAVRPGTYSGPGGNGLSGPSGPGPGLGSLPPYFVAINANGNPNFVSAYAVVRTTKGGSLLGTVKPPPGYSVLAVTGAADDRTFVLDEAKSSANGTLGTRSFYLLRLKPSGAPASVTKLPMTAGSLVTGVALSPDGTMLAIAVQPQDNAADSNLTELRVYTLATGAVRTWSENNGVIGNSEDDAASISWTADGRSLAFDWGGSGSQQGAWLLDTTRGGSGLLADSRQVMSTYIPTQKAHKGTTGSSSSPAIPSSLPTIPSSLPAIAGSLPTIAPTEKPPTIRELTCQGDEVVTPDGSAIICPALATFNEWTSKNGLHRDAETGFLEYSVATGKVIRILGHWVVRSAAALSINVLWSNPSGTTIVGAIPNQGDGEVGVISGNAMTPLPIPADLNPAYAGVW